MLRELCLHRKSGYFSFLRFSRFLEFCYFFILCFHLVGMSDFKLTNFIAQVISPVICSENSVNVVLSSRFELVEVFCRHIR